MSAERLADLEAADSILVNLMEQLEALRVDVIRQWLAEGGAER